MILTKSCRLLRTFREKKVHNIILQVPFIFVFPKEIPWNSDLENYRSFPLSCNKKVKSKPFNKKGKNLECCRRHIYKSPLQFYGPCVTSLLCCHSVERNVIELCMEQPCWCTTVAHPYGGQKSARTSGVHHFATKAHTFCSWDKIHLYLPSQVGYLELLLLFAYFKSSKMSPIQETISRNVHSL